LAEFLPYSGLEAKREITWHSGLTIASNARNGIEMRAPSRLRNCKSSKKSRSGAKRSGIKTMSSRRGSETDQNPEGSIEARGGLKSNLRAGFEFVGTLVRKHCDGAGMPRTGLRPVPLGPSGRSQPSQGCPIKGAILARWRARDPCADRSAISGHRDTFSGHFRCPRIHPTLLHLCGSQKDEVSR